MRATPDRRAIARRSLLFALRRSNQFCDEGGPATVAGPDARCLSLHEQGVRQP